MDEGINASDAIIIGGAGWAADGCAKAGSLVEFFRGTDCGAYASAGCD
jgi:hypothetical protein